MITRQMIMEMLESISNEAYEIDCEYGLPDANQAEWMVDAVRAMCKAGGAEVEPKFIPINHLMLKIGDTVKINCDELRVQWGTDTFVFHEMSKKKPGYAWIYIVGDWDVPAHCPFGGAQAILMSVSEFGRYE